ncbi:Asp23/Gls24 family envelope stress response protein [Streptomyces uncialis]|uniref:Asp23/Gls24 family envelope stress response protein n=1 Tax=Streptomyces uncialis TaxID=1048205 RepID=UPI0036506ED0
MTSQDTRRTLEGTVADAVRPLPGVAYLRPALTDLLRGAVARPVGSAGVRAVPAPDGRGWRIDVKLTTLRGHRAVDVSRAVRDVARAAALTLLEPDGTPDIEITVTVTGVL